MILMDCTLRDGANVVGKGFDAKLTKMMIEGLIKSNIKIIEMGNCLGIGAYEADNSISPLDDQEYLDLVQPYLDKAEIGMFIGVKNTSEKNIAKAALYYSDYCMVHNKYKAAMCYLKISASLKYIPAIHKYATLIYKNVNYRNRENMKNILPIYLYIYEHKNENEWKNYLIQDIAAKIGSIYFWDANYVNAKKFLEENIDCEISNYFLGMMYFNGYGVVQNLEKTWAGMLFLIR